MDDIKLYAATNNQLKELWLTETFSRDIKMVFGIENAKLKYCKGETRNEKLHNIG